MKKFGLSCAVGALVLTAVGEPAEQDLKPIGPEAPFAFVVFGDNRGDASGQQPESFRQVLASIGHEDPALILDSGDMIYGHTLDEAELRAQWETYRDTVKGVRAPTFHVPGNHDLWDERSAQLYRKLWGPTYYAFTYGNSRFVALDTETTAARLDVAQFDWLKAELKACNLPNIFLFMHRPLFPVDGGVGSSLDAFPKQRDQLHQLFVAHRDRIRGVFAGHEHLYNYQERDGIRYYTSGGGGAPLYMAPERGGFHHFLKVRVAGEHVEVALHKICAPGSVNLSPRPIAPGETLESWEQGLSWFAWDRSASIEIVSSNASDGHRALRLNFDLAQYPWPVLVAPFPAPRDFSDAMAVSIDVYVPKELTPQMSLSFAAQGLEKHESPPVNLKPGWNTVETRLSPDWLPKSEQHRLETLEWGLSSTTQKGAGYVLFDNLKVREAKSADSARVQILESWERPLLWRVFDESVRTEIGLGVGPEKTGGLLLHQDWATCKRPMVFAQLNPPWDLSKVKSLLLGFRSSGVVPADLALRLVLRASDTDYSAPGIRLNPGAAELRFELAEKWLPSGIRAKVEQIAFLFETTNQTTRADLLFHGLRAGTEATE